MDVKREGVAKKKMVKRIIILTLTVAAVGAISWQLSKLKPAAPTVERATVWIDSVKRGPMVREVRGLGTLVPEDIVWIPAQFDSQVAKVGVHSGDEVKPGTILVVLSNPDMEVTANDFEWQVKRAEAAYADLKVKMQSNTFDQQSIVDTTNSDMKQAELTKERDQELLKLNLKADMDVKLSVANWEKLVGKYKIEKQKLDILKQSVDAQLEAQQVQIDQLKAQWALKKKQVQELTITAGIAGRVQEMTLQQGQKVKPGDVLAKVAQPWKLMARLNIAETQAKDIILGQKAEVDTRNGIVAGHVIRIDASIVNGTRTVDCKLDGALPPGAVPDLSVDGTIEIERLADVVFVGRPVFGQPNSQVGLFKLDEDGKGATRTTVKLGRSSVNTIEVTEGLKVGDQVILSDMSAQDQNPRIRLN
ncbi:MAG TPA: efflux RND transporter periplasmic adaptor subunit [Bryobacteraceae bacterium]|nr:efflux RND transporter periplasmic adaptor subunit [Bryobacteraceae bacterium]